MAGELDGKVAIVTGGASGIGRAAVELFAREGASVVIADIQDERGNTLAEDLGSRVIFHHTDVSDGQSVEALVGAAISRFGGLDVMFNNAGVAGNSHARFLDDDLSDFHKVMNVDLLGVMLGCRHAGRYMADHGGGSIINTASTGGSFAGFGVMTYRAAKAGVIAVTKSLAIDFGEYNIRVNSISPGPTKTEMTTMEPIGGLPRETMEQLEQASMAAMMGMQPLKRMGQGEDIAQAALFLASDRSRQVSGLDFIVGGASSVGDPVNRLEQMQTAMAGIMGAAKAN